MSAGLPPRPAAPSGARAQVPAAPRALIVLGAAVWAGGRPSPALARRVRRAVAIWRPGDVVIVTGGIGTHPPSEAEAAARLARALGLPAAAILREDRSASTVANIANAVPRVPCGARPVLVTDRFHCARACAVACALGRPMPAAAARGRPGLSAGLRARMTLREVCAFLPSVARALRVRRAAATSDGFRGRP